MIINQKQVNGNRISLIIFLIFLTFSIITSCNRKTRKQNPDPQPVTNEKVTSVNFLHPDLKLVWETPKDLKVPESVLSNGKFIYVSNINGKPTDKDGNGFISKLSIDGDIESLEWVTGLNAPKGMGIFQGKLYVSDINQVVVIDIEKAKIINRYQAEGSGFLNDIAIDKQGRVFISDMRMNAIYLLEKNQLMLWLNTEALVSPNGLYVDENYLMIGINNKVLKVNIYNKNTEIYLEDTGGIDGLEAVGDGRYIFSDWTGHIYIAEPGAEKTLLLDTTPEKIQAADIFFVKETKVVLVPTFSDNRVMAYKLNF